MEGKKNYLGVVTDMVTSLILHDSVAVDVSSFPTLTLKYAGCLGSATIIAVSLLRWSADQSHFLVHIAMQF